MAVIRSSNVSLQINYEKEFKVILLSFYSYGNIYGYLQSFYAASVNPPQMNHRFAFPLYMLPPKPDYPLSRPRAIRR